MQRGSVLQIKCLPGMELAGGTARLRSPRLLSGTLPSRAHGARSPYELSSESAYHMVTPFWRVQARPLPLKSP